jgi:type 1 glutamine amidotransferase
MLIRLPIVMLVFVAMAVAGPAQSKPIRVLIVTGADHPAHRWHENSLAIRDALAGSERFEVRVSEDPEILATRMAERYDVIVLNYCNWEKPSPSKEALEGLVNFVGGGKGLVVIHFSSGSFPDWPEYVKLIGRVWDKVRTHDPYRTFSVNVADKEHPITRRLVNFDISDELYFCLTGKPEIRILLTARSEVTKKDEPMGFVLRYGKGRVFHTPLGHDVKGLTAPGFVQLLRRACEWAATGDVKD